MVKHYTTCLLGYCKNLGDRLMLWVDILPVISAIGAIAGLSLKAGRILQKLDYVIEVLETKVNAIEKRLAVV